MELGLAPPTTSLTVGRTDGNHAVSLACTVSHQPCQPHGAAPFAAAFLVISNISFRVISYSEVISKPASTGNLWLLGHRRLSAQTLFLSPIAIQYKNYAYLYTLGIRSDLRLQNNEMWEYRNSMAPNKGTLRYTYSLCRHVMSSHSHDLSRGHCRGLWTKNPGTLDLWTLGPSARDRWTL